LWNKVLKLFGSIPGLRFFIGVNSKPAKELAKETLGIEFNRYDYLDAHNGSVRLNPKYARARGVVLKPPYYAGPVVTLDYISSEDNEIHSITLLRKDSEDNWKPLSWDFRT
jgi:hypothetical protein